MSTHNITDGTGGLDASIYYEYTRPENIGAGIIESLNDFAGSANKYVSRADLIAMGAVWGVTGCGVPPITFRGGRVDAYLAGLPGVPEPQQDLATHTEKFRLQGFTPTEMIGLVACGHTLGAVRNLDFPEIVPSSKPAGDERSVQSFDSTIAFDSTIVSEYLNGTTGNPLVVVANTTLQSDLRIFASDGNVTMKSIESPAAFNQTCSTLFERMLNTVPAGVQLTEDITFVPFKIRHAQITIDNSQLLLHVSIRVQIPAGATRTPMLLWCDKRGAAADCADGQANFASAVDEEGGLLNLSPLSKALGYGALVFDFTAPIGDESVGKFWFEVAEADGPVVLQDNGGAGYTVKDTLIALTTAVHADNTPGPLGRSLTFEITAGIRNGSKPSLAQVYVHKALMTSIPTEANATLRVIPPIINATIPLQRNNSIPSVAGYTFWSANFTGFHSANFDFAAEINGTRYEVDFVSSFSSFFEDLTTLSAVGKRPIRLATNSTSSSSFTSPTKTSSSLGWRDWWGSLLGWKSVIAISGVFVTHMLW